MYSEGIEKRKVELADAYNAALRHFTDARRSHAHGDPVAAGEALMECRDALDGLMAMAEEDAGSPPPAPEQPRRRQRSGNARTGVSARRFRLYRAVPGGSWEIAGSGTAASLAQSFDVTPSQVYTMARHGNASRDGRWRVEELCTPGF